MITIFTAIVLLSVFVAGIYIGYRAGKSIFTQREIEMYEAIGYDLQKIQVEKAEYKNRIKTLETEMKLHNIEPGKVARASCPCPSPEVSL